MGTTQKDFEKVVDNLQYIPNIRRDDSKDEELANNGKLPEIIDGWLPDDAYLVTSRFDKPITGEFTIIGSFELEAYITAKMQELFFDYYRTSIQMGKSGHLEVVMYFVQNSNEAPPNKLSSVINLAQPQNQKSQNNWEKMQMLSNRIAGKSFTINDSTKKLLSPFLFGGASKNSYKNKKAWQNHLFTVSSPAYNGVGQVTAVAVKDIDIKALMNFIMNNKLVVPRMDSVGDYVADEKFAKTDVICNGWRRSVVGNLMELELYLLNFSVEEVNKIANIKNPQANLHNQMIPGH